MFRINKCVALTFALLFVLTFTQSGFSQTAESGLLDRRVGRFDVDAKNLHLALSAIANQYKLPIGLELARDGNDGPSIKIHMKNGTLRDLLIATIRQDSRYEWVLDNGVVNVYPRVKRDPFLHDLLETSVQNFKIVEGTNRFDVKASLAKLPEVESILERSKVTLNVAAYSNRDYTELGPGFSSDLSNMTVKEILNYIVGHSATKYWIVNRSYNDDQSIIINF